MGIDGIFVADGHVWKHTRKLASHIFSAGQFKSWIQYTLHGELDNVLSILDQATSSKNGKNQLEMPELFFRYTLSSFSKMAFSKDVECLKANKECLSEPVAFADSFDFAQSESLFASSAMSRSTQLPSNILPFASKRRRTDLFFSEQLSSTGDSPILSGGLSNIWVKMESE